LAGIDLEAAVLDVGCGHGLAAEHLARARHRGIYLGVDSSEPLIGLARQQVDAGWATFRVADIAEPGWCEAGTASAFDWVLAFAVLHHIPDAALRRQVAGDLRSALGVGGRAAVSVWDFAASERLRQRVVGWDHIGLAPADVEPGDALLDWRHEGRGLRYVHHFSPEELSDLARVAGFAVEQEYRADGEGGRLGLYQIWRA
jgi:SAM-dependent methyltransferase